MSRSHAAPASVTSLKQATRLSGEGEVYMQAARRTHIHTYLHNIYFLPYICTLDNLVVDHYLAT